MAAVFEEKLNCVVFFFCCPCYAEYRRVREGAIWRESARTKRTGKKINKDLCKELVEAAERGETERVRELLRMEGVDVRHAEGEYWAWKKTALLVACVGGHLETARVILEYGGQTQKELKG